LDKGSIGHAFASRIHTEYHNINEAFSLLLPCVISVHTEPHFRTPAFSYSKCAAPAKRPFKSGLRGKMRSEKSSPDSAPGKGQPLLLRRPPCEGPPFRRDLRQAPGVWLCVHGSPHRVVDPLARCEHPAKRTPRGGAHWGRPTAFDNSEERQPRHPALLER